MTYSPPKLLGLGTMARRLRVSTAWLRAEAEADRLPHVKAAQQILFSPDAVERILLKRAEQVSSVRSAAESG